MKKRVNITVDEQKHGELQMALLHSGITFSGIVDHMTESLLIQLRSLTRDEEIGDKLYRLPEADKLNQRQIERSLEMFRDMCELQGRLLIGEVRKDLDWVERLRSRLYETGGGTAPSEEMLIEALEMYKDVTQRTEKQLQDLRESKN